MSNIKNISCYYGFEDKFIDVTNIVLDKFKRNNSVILPKNCNFNSFFGDPYEGKLKELRINIDGEKYKISENSLNKSITFCLLKGQLDIIDRDIILVTGGSGFIGSNFINYMVKKYSEIDFVNIDCLYYCSSQNNITVNDKDNYFFEKGDINDIDFIMNVLNKYSINKIIHFAAQSHVDNSFSNPIQYTKDNILGTQNLLECCRNYGNIKKIIHVSTDEVYGESHLNSTNKKTELDILCPTNPYAASKAGAEMIVNAYRFSYNLPIIITRSNNVYGKNQYPEKLIPKFITMLNNNKKVTIHGNGKNKRNFIHVGDVIRAFDIILDRGEIGEIYNIGSNDTNEYSVNDIAKMLINIIKPTDDISQWLSFESDRNFNDFRYNIDNSKLRSLGWEQCVDFKDSLISLVHWYTREINYIKHWNIRKALNITLFCDSTKYSHYQDYVESILRNIDNCRLILYVRNEDILHYMKQKINHIYIFIQLLHNILIINIVVIIIIKLILL
jgi:dTDP-glucose 4,6-dehydratase